MNLLAPQFQCPDSAREYLESVLWSDGPVCPHCGSMEGAYRIKARPGSKNGARPGLCKCKGCKRQFTVTVNTVMHRSKVPLNKWLLAFYLLNSSKKGFSAHQLHRSIGVTYKTAWFMMHRIRKAMEEGGVDMLGGDDKPVEADESYWGNSRSKFVKKSTGGHHKMKVFALVERGGTLRTFHVNAVNAKTLTPLLLENVKRDSRLMTDTFGSYYQVGKEFTSHETVEHGIKEYVRGDVYTNTLEGVFSLLKRGLHGSYHHVSERHFGRYLNEFDYRYNGRNLSDKERTDEALRGVIGKRLTYRPVVGAA